MYGYPHPKSLPQNEEGTSMAQDSPSLLSGRGWGNVLYIYHSFFENLLH